jgi:hypothetical protein
MPCDFRTIRPNAFTLPTAGDIDIDLEFDAPGVNADRRAILMYRASVTAGGNIFGGTATLVATLNGEAIFEHVLSIGADRSFHRIIDSKIVQSGDNKLTLTRKSEAGAGAGTGTIHLSDFVLIFGL